MFCICICVTLTTLKPVIPVWQKLHVTTTVLLIFIELAFEKKRCWEVAFVSYFTYLPVRIDFYTMAENLHKCTCALLTSHEVMNTQCMTLTGYASASVLDITFFISTCRFYIFFCTLLIVYSTAKMHRLSAFIHIFFATQLICWTYFRLPRTSKNEILVLMLLLVIWYSIMIVALNQSFVESLSYFQCSCFGGQVPRQCCFVYDPVFSSVEMELIGELGLQLITVNEVSSSAAFSDSFYLFTCNSWNYKNCTPSR